MADEKETAAPTYSVEYLGAGKTEEPIGWISKAGKANVKYANGDTYCGDYNELKQRHGRGRYTYIRKGNEEDEEAKPTTSVYDGDFRLGKNMVWVQCTYPDGGKYNGSWEDDKKLVMDHMNTQMAIFTTVHGLRIKKTELVVIITHQTKVNLLENGKIINMLKENGYIKTILVITVHLTIICL